MTTSRDSAHEITLLTKKSCKFVHGKVENAYSPIGPKILHLLLLL